jgi:DNA-binding response OmpR family regulator
MSPPSSSSPKHLLAIDDEAPILDLLKEYLTVHGYRVSTATTSADAKRIVQVDRPDLIISDLQLEDTDGLHLVEQLRRQVPECPAILLTGVLFDAQVVEENLRWKISAYVSKTAPLQVLLQEIQRQVGN